MPTWLWNEFVMSRDCYRLICPVTSKFIKDIQSSSLAHSGQYLCYVLALVFHVQHKVHVVSVDEQIGLNNPQNYVSMIRK